MDISLTTDFVSRYKGAIIFLAFLLVVTVILVLVYLMLKRGVNCCFCCTKKPDEEESLYTDPEHDESESELEKEPLVGNGDFHHGDKVMEAEDEMHGESYPPDYVPEIIVTESNFTHPKKSKKKQLSSMFKKIRRGKGKVRFSPSSEQISMLSSEGTISTSEYGSTNMSLLPLERSDSMESFMSALSTATTNNIDEFGDDLSPSRIQVFLQYDPKLWTLVIGCKQAECLVTTSGVSMYWQAHLTLLPFKKHRFKTKYKSTSTPIFNQNFEIENIAQQALTQLSVRFRIYGRPGRGGRKKLAGETEVELSHIGQMEDMIIKDWRVLRRKGGPFVKHESEV